MCWSKRFFVQIMDFSQISCPTRIWRQSHAFFKDQTLELINAKLCHQKFDARPVAILLFTEAGKHMRDRLGGRQQFLFRKEPVKQLGLMWNCTKPAPDV